MKNLGTGKIDVEEDTGIAIFNDSNLRLGFDPQAKDLEVDGHSYAESLGECGITWDVPPGQMSNGE